MVLGVGKNPLAPHLLYVAKSARRYTTLRQNLKCHDPHRSIGRRAEASRHIAYPARSEDFEFLHQFELWRIVAIIFLQPPKWLLLFSLSYIRFYWSTSVSFRIASTSLDSFDR